MTRTICSTHLFAIGLPVAVLAFASALTSGCASPSSSELAGGDGVVVAPTGASAFEMQFDSISLAADSDRTFQFDHVPATDMHLTLSIDGASEETARLIDRAGISVRAELVGVAGSSQPDSYTLRDGLLEGEWTRAPRAGDPGANDYVGIVFKPRRHERFALTLRVRVARPGELGGRELLATPMVRGGRPLSTTPMHRGSESAATP